MPLGKRGNATRGFETFPGGARELVRTCGKAENVVPISRLCRMDQLTVRLKERMTDV